MIYDFIKNNYQWIFSGIGVLLISIVLGINANKKLSQKIGNKSKGIIAGRDINIGSNINEAENRK